MQQLFLLIYRFRATLLFLLFEALCAWLIIQNNFYQRAQFLNSSNAVSGSVLETSDNIYDYFTLGQVNRQLAEENASLRQQLQEKLEPVALSDSLDPGEIDTLLNVQMRDTVGITYDTVKQFKYLPAEVVSNTVRNVKNYITINKGSAQGIKQGMGVVGSDGVVGSVKAASKNYAVIHSLLHNDMSISAKIKRTDDLGSVQWRGVDFTKASLLFIPKHVSPQPGDTIVSSGYNAIFPPGILIGVIDAVEESEGSFYDITIDLAVAFNELSYVYVIKNEDETEIDSLQNATIE